MSSADARVAGALGALGTSGALGASVPAANMFGIAVTPYQTVVKLPSRQEQRKEKRKPISRRQIAVILDDAAQQNVRVQLASGKTLCNINLNDLLKHESEFECNNAFYEEVAVQLDIPSDTFELWHRRKFCNRKSTSLWNLALAQLQNPTSAKWSHILFIPRPTKWSSTQLVAQARAIRTAIHATFTKTLQLTRQDPSFNNTQNPEYMCFEQLRNCASRDPNVRARIMAFMQNLGKQYAAYVTDKVLQPLGASEEAYDRYLQEHVQSRGLQMIYRKTAAVLSMGDGALQALQDLEPIIFDEMNTFANRPEYKWHSGTVPPLKGIITLHMDKPNQLKRKSVEQLQKKYLDNCRYWARRMARCLFVFACGMPKAFYKTICADVLTRPALSGDTIIKPTPHACTNNMNKSFEETTFVDHFTVKECLTGFNKSYDQAMDMMHFAYDYP
ncbi:hypothetical protein OAM67_01315 [bacterium]|nr:hypothetical protein [bacterium]